MDHRMKTCILILKYLLNCIYHELGIYFTDCPWINNCVGEWNQKYFLQFLFYVGVLSAYAVFLVVFSWIQDCQDCHKDKFVTQTRM